MNYLKNKFLLHFLNILNTFGRGYALKNKIFSSRRVLSINFPPESEFNFVQIGANDGVSFDFLYDFVITRQSTGLVIEPVKDYFEDLVRNYKDYPKISKINMAVHFSEKSKPIYKIKDSSKHKYPEWVKGIASFDELHHQKLKIAREDMEAENVSTDTLMNLLSNFYPYQKIDYLQIDTEGYDLEVLKMIDFSIFKPSIIKYEHVNLEKKELVVSKELLSKEGYILYKRGNDILGYDLRQIRLI